MSSVHHNGWHGKQSLGGKLYARVTAYVLDRPCRCPSLVGGRRERDCGMLRQCACPVRRLLGAEVTTEAYGMIP